MFIKDLNVRISVFGCHGYLFKRPNFSIWLPWISILWLILTEDIKFPGKEILDKNVTTCPNVHNWPMFNERVLNIFPYFVYFIFLTHGHTSQGKGGVQLPPAEHIIQVFWQTHNFSCAKGFVDFRVTPITLFACL